mgnify:CR=1 FL=1
MECHDKNRAIKQINRKQVRLSPACWLEKSWVGGWTRKYKIVLSTSDSSMVLYSNLCGSKAEYFIDTSQQQEQRKTCSNYEAPTDSYHPVSDSASY